MFNNQPSERAIMKTHTIQLRVDFDSEEKHEIIKAAVKRAAQQLIATASLIQDKRQPQCIVESEDYFTGTEEIKLSDD